MKNKFIDFLIQNGELDNYCDVFGSLRTLDIDTFLNKIEPTNFIYLAFPWEYDDGRKFEWEALHVEWNKIIDDKEEIGYGIKN